MEVMGVHKRMRADVGTETAPWVCNAPSVRYESLGGQVWVFGVPSVRTSGAVRICMPKTDSFVFLTVYYACSHSFEQFA